jgi:hypothetical protein
MVWHIHGRERRRQGSTAVQVGLGSAFLESAGAAPPLGAAVWFVRGHITRFHYRTRGFVFDGKVIYFHIDKRYDGFWSTRRAFA